MGLIFGSPVRGTIYGTPGTINGAARWYMSQRFGCTGFSWEPPLGSCAHYHRAIDIARGPAGCGDDVLALASGTVFFAGFLNDGAMVVNIRHDGGYATGYAHLSARIVSRGQRVTRGQKIGSVGMTGRATGCHIHLAFKTGFPGTGDVNAFWGDRIGTWANAWPRLQQNVTVRAESDGINIRLGAGTPGGPPSAVYARTKGGRILRESDGVDLGAWATWRKYGGTVKGAGYTISGASGSAWDKLFLLGAYRYLATPLAQRSV